MDQVALHLRTEDGWTYLGGDDEARKDLEVVVRAFDQEVEISLGDSADAPSGETTRVPAGEGRRLVGRHFFVRGTVPGPCRITQRGL